MTKRTPQSKRIDSRAKGEPTAVKVVGGAGETREAVLAKVALMPSYQAMATTSEYLKNVFGELDMSAMHANILERSDRVLDGDMRPIEAMLIGQAQALQAIFTSMARRAALNAGEHVTAADTYLRLALKAQAQSRATLETLAEIKNPQPTAFIRQQNIAANQQVSNGGGNSPNCTRGGARAGAEEPENRANELMAVAHVQIQRLDLGTTAAAGAGNSAMAAVAAGKRA